MANPFRRRELSDLRPQVPWPQSSVRALSAFNAFNALCTCPIPIRSRSIFSSELPYLFLHPYLTQATSHISLVLPGAASSVALPKSSPLNDVPRRLPTPSLTSSSVHVISLPPSTSGSRDLGPCRWIATVKYDHSSTMSFSRVQDILLNDDASTCWGVACWMFGFGFGFCTTASVDVEQVSECMLWFRLNTPSPSPVHHSTFAQVCTSKDKVSE